MKIECDIADINRDEVIEAMAAHLLDQMALDDHDEPTKYRERSPLAERLGKAVQRRVESLASETVRTCFDETIRARIAVCVDEVLAEGWQQTNQYGERTGAKLDLKARVSEMLTQTRGDGYNRTPSVLDAQVKTAIDGFLGKEFQPVIEAAKANLKKCLDEKVMKTVSETIANAVGLR